MPDPVLSDRFRWGPDDVEVDGDEGAAPPDALLPPLGVLGDAR